LAVGHIASHINTINQHQAYNHSCAFDKKTILRETDRTYTNRQTSGQTDGWTDRQTDGPIDKRVVDKQID